MINGVFYQFLECIRQVLVVGFIAFAASIPASDSRVVVDFPCSHTNLIASSSTTVPLVSKSSLIP